MTGTDLIEKWVYRQTPYAFRNAARAFDQWRTQLAECLEVEPTSICVIGSTAAGLSFNPTKRLRLHSPQSDVDVAVISQELFRMAWDWFIAKRIEFISFPGPVKGGMDDHKKRLIFYRQIGLHPVLDDTQLSKSGLPLELHRALDTQSSSVCV